jgi:hypothetical protein
MNAPIPLWLAAHLREVGVVVLTPPKPADPHVDAVMTGISSQWKPTPGDTDPPF